MAGIIGIYGLVVSVLISNDLKQATPLYTGFIQLGAGLSVGLAGLAAGFAIGIVGDAGVRGTAQQPRLFVGMILILIFAEVLGEFDLGGTCNQHIAKPSRSIRSDCRAFDELPRKLGRFLLDHQRDSVDEQSCQVTHARPIRSSNSKVVKMRINTTNQSHPLFLRQFTTRHYASTLT